MVTSIMNEGQAKARGFSEKRRKQGEHKSAKIERTRRKRQHEQQGKKK